MKIISIGEVLWDIIGEAEHLGGASLNFAAHANKLGHKVVLVSAVGTDERGDRVLQCMQTMNLSPRYVTRVRDYPTGIVTVKLDSAGQPSFVIHRPAAYDFPSLTTADLEVLHSPPPDLIYFGTLQQMSAQAKQLTLNLLKTNSHARRFYDANLRTGCYSPALLRELMAHATILKLNDREADEITSIFGKSYRSLEEFSREFLERFGFEAVCITRGARGCSLLLNGEYIEREGYSVNVADAVGAGDAFAAALVHGLGNDWPVGDVADFANRVGALVASRQGAIPAWMVEEARALSQQVKSAS